ncbi:MAG: hypothetical protein H6586_06810 [Flavobacteriales bacterium]|nr:hypothetical protein [Flavobacteriales bacterium]
MKKRILISGACLSLLFAGASIFSINQNKVELNNAEARDGYHWECVPFYGGECCIGGTCHYGYAPILVKDATM